MEMHTRRELRYLHSTNVFQEMWMQRWENFFCPQGTHSVGETDLDKGNDSKVIDRCEWLYLPPSCYMEGNEAQA